MVQHTRHPASAPPTAPERESSGRLLLRAYVIVVLVVAFGNSAVYNLVGMPGSVVVLAALTAATLGIWIPAIVRARPVPVPWRRLPWAALGYGALALLSVVWSHWPAATLLTWALLASLTVNALFVAHMLSWREILRAISSALKWLLGLSLAIELWVALVLRHPILPFFFDAPDDEINPHWYWVRGNLIDGGRIQGIVGNANLLAALCLVAIIVFGALLAARVRWRTTLGLWIVVSGYLLLRAGSATMFVAAVVAAIALAVALLMRTTDDARRRRWCYLGALGGIAAFFAAVVAFRGQVLELLGRDSDLTGRLQIWEEVLDRAASSPLVGLGFSSPWIPSEPEVHEWIVDQGITVFHAHNMWIDVLFQLGWLGLAFMGLAYLGLLWRSWFFAIDRPRWDLRDDRPYSPLTLVPNLVTVVLLVQGLTESAPIMTWGWMLLVLFSFKIKSVPLLGIGLSERERVIERGGRPRRVP